MHILTSSMAKSVEDNTELCIVLYMQPVRSPTNGCVDGINLIRPDILLS